MKQRFSAQNCPPWLASLWTLRARLLKAAFKIKHVGSGEAGNKSITDLYEKLPNEAIILNTIGAALVGLAIVMPCILKCDAFKKGLEPEAGDNSDIE